MINAKVKKKCSLSGDVTIRGFIDMTKDEIGETVSLDTTIDAGVIILKPEGTNGLITIPLSGGLGGIKFFIALPDIARNIAEEVMLNEKENVAKAFMEAVLEKMNAAGGGKPNDSSDIS